MAKLEMKTRKKIVAEQKYRYTRASKKEKGAILDGICLTTGLSRSRAKHILTASNRNVRIGSTTVTHPGRKPKYGDDVRIALEKVWVLMDYASGRRLCAGMDDMLDSLLRFEECDFSKPTQRLLRSLSPSTADRLLKKTKESMLFKGKSTTKPGTLLKKK